MIEDPSEQQAGKLILPAAPTEAHYAPAYRAYKEQQPAGRLIRKNQVPSTFPAKLIYLWRRDPAYKVLFIAIGFVLISSIVCVSLLAGFVTQPSSPTPITSLPPRPQQTPTVLSTPEISATPTASALPTPMPTPTPIMAPTPVATAPTITQPTPNPGPLPTEKLTVQIGAIPAQINNDTIVPITVNTNKPGATISLFISSTAIPLLYSIRPLTADSNGNATFSWDVHERTLSPFTRAVSANITAMARYQTNQQARSQTTTVHILLQ